MGVLCVLRCVQYGALMIVDPEDEFYQEEVTKLEHDVKHLGLGKSLGCVRVIGAGCPFEGMFEVLA